MRCLTLADALREQGAQYQFVCREHTGNLIDYIRSRGYKVHALPVPQPNASFEADLAHAHWLGVDWQTDAAQTDQALDSDSIDWLVADHYALDRRWESAMRPVFKRLMVIDDLADRRHDCDILLDQNHGSSAKRYSGLVPADCKQLHGPEFALLKPVYKHYRARRAAHSGRFERVFVYFGSGSHSMNLARMVLNEFHAPELMKFQLDIVVGPSCPYRGDLEAAAAARGRTHIHEHLPDLADLMVKADLAIGAGGATTWERCCLGLPSIVISIADNQKPACEALAVDGIIQYLGYVDDISSDMIRKKVIELIDKPQVVAELSERDMKFVDGNGLSRVVDALGIK